MTLLKQIKELAAVMVLFNVFIFPTFAESGLRIVSLHPLWTEMAESIGGERVSAYTVLPEGEDPHFFEPFPKDLKKIGQCDLLLASGKGLEPYAQKLRSQLKPTARFLELGAAIPDPSTHSVSCGHDHDHEHAHPVDPHWWLDPNNMMRAARALTKALVGLDPERQVIYESRLRSYRMNMEIIDKITKTRIQTVPTDSRILAVAHPAYAYFCEAYDFQQIPIEGLTEEAVPSALELQRIIQQIKDAAVPAIFPELQSNPKLLKVVADSCGITMQKPLYVDSLPPHDPSYSGLMNHNATLIAEALGESTP